MVSDLERDFFCVGWGVRQTTSDGTKGFGHFCPSKVTPCPGEGRKDSREGGIDILSKEKLPLFPPILYFRVMQKVLFIGLVWPEPTSSAAGTRIIQLVECFLSGGYEVTFASAAAKSPHSYDWEPWPVAEQSIILNDSSFDSFIKDLQPDMVVFDRFIIEEQYGWRVRETLPQAITILDTEDLHFLRKARQLASSKNESIVYHNDIAKREIASILRCDLSLMISKTEIQLLTEQFQLSSKILFYLPFLEDEIDEKRISNWKGYDDREDFMFIGNFLHEPNWHTTLILKKEIWPRLRELLPEASLHIYGAYATEKVYQLHNPKERFFIKDRADDAREAMENYRVLLAPIPFGAGAKGKLIDAMQSGTPNITTSVGAESMSIDGRWNGFIEDEWNTFVQKAQQLYRSSSLWKAMQQQSINLLNKQYSKQMFCDIFLKRIEEIQKQVHQHREGNFIGEILKSQQFNSTKYMSLWIEEKNK
ncbi:Glycosyltransferase involved in cell wall bisynthesis [Sphingobacterium wenxiniae]|uniref:Glycosyltransferase involved in cell wall bisynthesis n=1 Tax=Sphingobacterium wenxiniae TaxID=683125 RepID=A0A1I6RB74_9SPHI|nr:Glycosyltransferase involved in cell wall bisynthesis [Sphingobacterium wenxiniae]